MAEIGPLVRSSRRLGLDVRDAQRQFERRIRGYFEPSRSADWMIGHSDAGAPLQHQSEITQTAAETLENIDVSALSHGGAGALYGVAALVATVAMAKNSADVSQKAAERREEISELLRTQVCNGTITSEQSAEISNILNAKNEGALSDPLANAAPNIMAPEDWS